MIKYILISIVVGANLAMGDGVADLQFPIKVDFTSSGVPTIASVAENFKKNAELQSILEKYESVHKNNKSERYSGCDFQQLTLCQDYRNTKEAYDKDGIPWKNVATLHAIVVVYVTFFINSANEVWQKDGRFFIFEINARSEWIHKEDGELKELSNSAIAQLKSVTSVLKPDMCFGVSPK